MKQSLYEMEYSSEVETVLNELRKKLQESTMGVTLVGNRLTLRFNDKSKNLVQVHMIIENVDDGLAEPEQDDK